MLCQLECCQKVAVLLIPSRHLLRRAAAIQPLSATQLKARCQSRPRHNVSFFLSPASFFSDTMQTLPSDHLDHIRHNTSKRGQGGKCTHCRTIFGVFCSLHLRITCRGQIERSTERITTGFSCFTTFPPHHLLIATWTKALKMHYLHLLFWEHPISRNCQLPLMRKSLLFSCKQQLISRVSPL